MYTQINISMNNNNNLAEDIKKSKAIERQVERWDLFAKLAPTVFLLVCFVLLISGSVSFDTVFTVGMIMFAITAVIWWFWAIFSIRRLVRILNKASNGLIDVSKELTEAKRELKEYIREEDNSSKRN